MLVGDPLQFSAVGRSGMFALLVDTYVAVQLDEVRRFAHDWDRAASLRLRRGDPAILEIYEEHGRIHGGDRIATERQILTAWTRARDDGATVAMLASTNDTVIRLNELAQRRRLDRAELHGRHTVTAGPYQICVGDEVVTRHNDRQLHTDQHRMVKNRDQWTVTTLHPSGELTVTGRTGTVRLPTGYVTEHVELAYAQTGHASQGRTVDRSLLLVDGPTDTRGVYVPMTRGRESNDVYVVADHDRTPIDILEAALAQNWIDVPAIVRRAELAGPASGPGECLRLEPYGPLEIGHLLETEHRLARQIERHDDLVQRLPRALEITQQRDAEARAKLQDAHHTIHTANTVLDRYDRLLHRRRHAQEISRAVSDIGWAERRQHELLTTIDETRREAGRITGELRTVTRDRAHRPGWQQELTNARDQIAEDLTLRIRRAPRDTPIMVVERLGARPADLAAARLWDTAAARIDQHRTAFTPIDGSLLGRASHGDSAFRDSQARAEHAIKCLDRTVRPELHRHLERSLDLGISM